MITIQTYNFNQAYAKVEQLCQLIIDSIAQGASIGFLPPLSLADATSYWQAIISDLQAEQRVLLVALDADQIVGSVQLDLPSKANASHRAEVQKLLVHSQFQRRGIAQQLMHELEAVAQTHGRWLLVLDTRQGDKAESLYRKLGYHEAGVIPNFARSADGETHATIMFYRELAH
ncbi:GNAT family N-acetyltransferase [Herpetosiphon llansteffanensis]|uniref:GNAT family N-acetyltransferase n=1 Tax=Herpetosiphon llansteffanensis TaxID=2094568 RepID=UPI000D7C5BE5|nr:GNAT family N-acetyltransferase [Herpetosiphon llansteffanensis]